MEIIEFLKTKLMHILNRESFHAPKIKQNLAVIHYRNFFWKLQVNFRYIKLINLCFSGTNQKPERRPPLELVW